MKACGKYGGGASGGERGPGGDDGGGGSKGGVGGLGGDAGDAAPRVSGMFAHETPHLTVHVCAPIGTSFTVVVRKPLVRLLIVQDPARRRAKGAAVEIVVPSKSESRTHRPPSSSRSRMAGGGDGDDGGVEGDGGDGGETGGYGGGAGGDGESGGDGGADGPASCTRTSTFDHPPSQLTRHVITPSGGCSGSVLYFRPMNDWHSPSLSISVTRVPSGTSLSRIHMGSAVVVESPSQSGS
eukprot:3516709-Prymnesium_polylepis.1